jgi:hypothetical protein
MRKDGRSALEEQPTLLARVLMGEINEIAVRHKLQGPYRVAYKRNSAGHHVIALVFEPQPP